MTRATAIAYANARATAHAAAYAPALANANAPSGVNQKSRMKTIKPVPNRTVHPPARPPLHEWLKEYRCGAACKKDHWLDWWLVASNRNK